jgi:WD40 repeat protein
VWMLNCAPLCDALTSNNVMLSSALVHRVQVWTSACDRSVVHSTHDSHQNSVRLLPLSSLNLLAVCSINGIVQLLNTHGTNFTVRSSFTQHKLQVHALAFCELEGLIISGGVSRLVLLHKTPQCQSLTPQAATFTCGTHTHPTLTTNSRGYERASVQLQCWHQCHL